MAIFAEISVKILTRYFIYISYKGTSYHGWQLQPGSLTVQNKMNEALSTILGEKISVTGAGRTDAGVHASVFCAHFDSMLPDLDKKKNLVFRLNRYLPPDISVTGTRKVRPDANARFSAISRTYMYRILRTKDPFGIETGWHVHGDLNIDAMNRATAILKKYNDFTSFCRLHSDNKTNYCTVFSAGWKQERNTLVFTIRADRFLRNMVRAIVGTMIKIGRGRITAEDFETILLARNRSSAGMSAPARGLFLTDIEYPQEIFE